MENCDTHQNGNWVLLFNLGWAIGRMVGAPVELGDPPTKTAQRFYSPLAGESNLLADLVGGSPGIHPTLPKRPSKRRLNGRFFQDGTTSNRRL